MKKELLFCTSSVGLGHVFRDLAIARELRQRDGDLRVTWWTASPAADAIRQEGERLHPGSANLSSLSDDFETSSKGHSLNIARALPGLGKTLRRNQEIFRASISQGDYCCIVVDECWDLLYGAENPQKNSPPRVFMTDFLKLKGCGFNPIDRLIIWMVNRGDYLKAYERFDLRLFLGNEEDLPQERFTIFGPKIVDWAKTRFSFMGPLLSFNPAQLPSKAQLRAKLGYDAKSVLIVASAGGTSCGSELLQLCADSYPYLKKRIEKIIMLICLGPRIDAGKLRIPEGVHLRGYVQDLHEHFAACDLAIVQGGLSSALELAALNIPFLYFPLKDHFEQTHYVPNILARYRAGLKMDFYKTGPRDLSSAVIRLLEEGAHYGRVPSDGAKKAASLIYNLIAGWSGRSLKS